jgi:hypothetical protein
MEQRASEERAAKQASDAISRYAHVMSFEGHEDVKQGGDADAVHKDMVLLRTDRQRQAAGHQADQALHKYASLLTFNGHDGHRGNAADAEALERHKQLEELRERKAAEGKARQQLHAYNLLSFHDEQLAVKELARARVAAKHERGGGGRGRIITPLNVQATPSKAASASGASPVAVRPDSPQARSSATTATRHTALGLQWNGKGIPRFD